MAAFTSYNDIDDDGDGDDDDHDYGDDDDDDDDYTQQQYCLHQCKPLHVDEECQSPCNYQNVIKM